MDVSEWFDSECPQCTLSYLSIRGWLTVCIYQSKVASASESLISLIFFRVELFKKIRKLRFQRQKVTEDVRKCQLDFQIQGQKDN